MTPTLHPQLTTPAEPWMLTLPADHGGTVCIVTLSGTCPRLIIQVRETDHNPGLPVSAAFPALATTIRQHLGCEHEPVWVEYWPSRALAAFILDRPVAARYRVDLSTRALQRQALSRTAYVSLTVPA